jgi:hypothetical protein
VVFIGVEKESQNQQKRAPPPPSLPFSLSLSLSLSRTGSALSLTTLLSLPASSSRPPCHPPGRADVVTDYWFRCASEKFLAGAQAAGTPAWAYRFNHLYSNASIFPGFGLPEICASVVCHASEVREVCVCSNACIRQASHLCCAPLSAPPAPPPPPPLSFPQLPFVFQNVPNFTSFTAAELLLSDAMISAWANFARTGNPNGPGAPVWPAWEPKQRLSLVLNDTMTSESTAGLCGFWDSIGGYFA